jgi:hypothetical protein
MINLHDRELNTLKLLAANDFAPVKGTSLNRLFYPQLFNLGMLIYCAANGRPVDPDERDGTEIS